MAGHFATVEALRRRPDSVIEIRHDGGLTEARFEVLARWAKEAGVPLVEDAGRVRQVRSKANVHVVAWLRRPEVALQEDATHVLLAGVADPGNVGAIVRSCAAFGVTDVAVVGGHDPWSPHALRASLGATFGLRVVTYSAWELYDASFPHRPWLAFDASGRHAVHDLTWPEGPCTLVFGSEWPGLNAELKARSTTVRIEQTAAVESLNVAVAAGIVLHAYATRKDHR